MSEEKYEIVIMGAGPSGLAAAYQLTRSGYIGKQILIVDKGLPLNRRLELRQFPSNINEIDYEVHGEGGADLFSDGKLSGYPAGSGLIEVLGEAKTKDLYKEAEDILSELGGSGKNYVGNANLTEHINESLNLVGLTFKYYPSRYITPTQLHTIVRNLRRYLDDAGVQFLYETEITDVVVKNHRDYACLLSLSTPLEKLSIVCDRLIIAVGKPGAIWFNDLCNSLKIKVNNNPVEVGLRIEVKASTLDMVTQSHNDLKIKRTIPQGEIRSFCTCVAGDVRYYRYAYGLLLDGAFSGSSNTNFSLVCRVHGISNPIQYGVSMVRKANILGNNKPILQRLGDLHRGKASMVSSIVSNSVTPTLKDYALENIRQVVPWDVIDPILKSLKDLSQVAPDLYSDDTLIYAPVLEMCWPKVELDEAMQTSVKGIYVAGDITGHVRGLVQAFATGIQVANGILNTPN